MKLTWVRVQKRRHKSLSVVFAYELATVDWLGGSPVNPFTPPLPSLSRPNPVNPFHRLNDKHESDSLSNLRGQRGVPPTISQVPQPTCYWKWLSSQCPVDLLSKIGYRIGILSLSLGSQPAILKCGYKLPRSCCITTGCFDRITLWPHPSLCSVWPELCLHLWQLKAHPNALQCSNWRYQENELRQGKGSESVGNKRHFSGRLITNPHQFSSIFHSSPSHLGSVCCWALWFEFRIYFYQNLVFVIIS